MAADRPLCDQPQFARGGRCYAIRSGDKQFFGVGAPEAAGPGGAARVVAGLIAALLRPVALPPGRFAAGVLCVRGDERLANATICRFCGCFCRKGIKCGAVRTSLLCSSRAGGQVAHGGCSLIHSTASNEQAWTPTFAAKCCFNEIQFL